MNSRMKKVSGWVLITLGSLHQIVHVLFELNPEKPPIVQQMLDFPIEMFGTHNLMKFHQGFSLMTGLFIISIGLLILIITKKIEDKQIDYMFMSIMLVIVIISVLYFHALAYGMSGIALVLYVVGVLKKQNSLKV